MAENQKRFVRKIQELTALYEISHAMASTLDFKSVLNQILEILSKKLEMNRGTVTLLDKETGHLSIEAAHGLTKEEISRGKYKIGEGVTGKVVEKGEPMIIPDIGKEPLFLNRTRARGDVKRQNISFLCIPIKVKGETLGVLSVDRLFKDADISFEEDVRLVNRRGVAHRAEPENPPNDRKRKRAFAGRQPGAPQRIARESINWKTSWAAPSPWWKFTSRFKRWPPPARTVIIRGESGTGKGTHRPGRPLQQSPGR